MNGTRRSVLDDLHRRLGARMIPFGGWEMPLQYHGVLEEHRACRSSCAIFDVSHLGSLRMTGPGAFDALQSALTNDLDRIGPGRAQYTHLLDPADAHVIDDIIVWWVGDGDFLVLPNAANTSPTIEALIDEARRVNGRTELIDVTASRALLAVQGPSVRTVLERVLPEVAAVGRFRVWKGEWRGATIVAAGTGYTGEDGVEIAVPEDAAEALWNELVTAGATPAGLGARDTLRLEMGYPLHGHELGAGITPLQARLGWVVRFDKGDFRGKAALEGERDRGVGRTLWGVRMEGRQAPREGYAVLHDNAVVGHITSGSFSPTLEVGIGLALLDTAFVDAAISGQTRGPVEPRVAIDVRGRSQSAVIVDPPFVRRGD